MCRGLIDYILHEDCLLLYLLHKVIEVGVLDKVRLVIYRCHEKGLEVLLINPNLKQDPSVWKRLPMASLEAGNSPAIQLETVDATGNKVKSIAIEADWHQIPSVRGIIRHDVERLKAKVSNCSYVCVKKALKEVMPDEYEALKELKDIITDRNLSLSI